MTAREYLVVADALDASRCGSSTSSLTFGTGSMSLTTQTGKSYVLNDDYLFVYLTSDETQYMYGPITAYNSGTGALTFTVLAETGTGTHTAWTLRQSISQRYSMNGYASKPSDTPASRHFPGRVIDPGRLKRSMYADGATRGRASIGSASVELDNGDNELDDLVDQAMDGMPIYLMRGEKGAAYSTFETFTPPLGIWFAGVLEQPVFNDNAKSRTITLAARDGIHEYDITLQRRKYGGTNALPAGVDGTEDDIKGKPLPIAYGICKNITPVQVNTSKQIYQVHFEGLSTGYAITVYDKRSAITLGADYVSQADMEATAPAAGQARVWPAGGMFRINFTPAGQITADVTNPYETYTDVYRVVRALLYVAGKDVATGALGLAANPDCGFYATEEMNLMDALDMVAESINGAYNADKFGAFYLRQLFDPTGVAADLEIDERNVISLQRKIIADPGNGIPAWQINLKYARNWTKMSAADVAGIAAADLAFVGEEYRTVQWTDATVKQQWPLAPELNITTLIDDEADAQDEADRLGMLHGVKRDLLDVLVPLDDTTVDVDINSVVELTHSQYGMSGGRKFSVLGYEINAKDETVRLTLWG